MIVASARDAANLLEDHFRHVAGERLAVLHLGEGRRVLGCDESPVAPGASLPLPIRDILAAALRRDSRGLVLAHNHPGGDPSPSAADIAATRALARAAAALGIRLHDHLIFAAGACRSFRAQGLL
jgi:DNA repair protein RadC